MSGSPSGRIFPQPVAHAAPGVTAEGRSKRKHGDKHGDSFTIRAERADWEVWRCARVQLHAGGGVSHLELFSEIFGSG